MIGRSNFRLLSDIKSKESTLQLIYDVMRMCPFFKAFLVTADVLEIYIQEFWATSTVHHHAIRFKINNKKHIVNLESFRDMLYICPRVHGQSFAEPPFEEKLLPSFIFLDTGLYHKRNVEYAYLMWEDFVYKVEHKNSKKSNEMYYSRFTKVIIHHFMSKDPSIPKRNKVSWHYLRDDHMFSTIKLVSRHQNTQQFDALLPIELTNKEIRNSNAYKEYYAITTGAAPPKPKASVQRTRSSSNTFITPPTAAAGPRLTTSQKGKQAAKASKSKSLSALSKVAITEAQQLKLVTKRSLQQTHISQASGSGADEGIGSILGVLDVPSNKSKEELSWNSTDDEDDDKDDGKDDEEEGGDDEQEYDEEEYDEETKDEKSFDSIPKTPKNSDDEGNGDEDLGLNVGGKEGHVEEEEEDELYRDVNINQGRGIQATLEVEDSHVTLTPVSPDGQQQSSSVSSQFVTSMLNPTLDVVKVAVQIQSNHLHDEAQRENDEFLKTVDENMQKIVKEQVKEQVKHPEWFSQQQKPPSPDHDWNKTVSATHGSIQSWISELAKLFDSRSSLNELMDTPLDFSNFLINWLKLEYHLEEVFKATTDQLEWVNPEGRQYPHSLLKPLPLIPNNRGRRVIPFEFINNDLEYLCGGASSQPIGYDKHALWGVSHWGRKRQQFYGFAINRESARDVYSKRRIITVTELKIVEWHSYKHLDWITVRRDDDKIYKFKEGDFKRLRIQDIKDMLLLLVQGKLTNLTVEERFAFNISLRMFTRSIVIQRRVEDLQLGVKSYQKKLNLTKSDSYRSNLERKEAYTTYSNPRGFIYQNKDKKNRLMRIDELHKFSDGTLTDVCTALDDRLKGIRMQYLPHSI
nr:hypothetical protein [Tanacetum cinerariifolium]